VAADRPIRICAANLDTARELAHALREAGALAELGREALIDLELAVVEAINNIVIHGYGAETGEIEMHLTVDGGLKVELWDRGRPIPADKLTGEGQASLMSENGRGLAIIRACVDRLDYRSDAGGNRLMLFKAVR